MFVDLCTSEYYTMTVGFESINRARTVLLRASYFSPESYLYSLLSYMNM